MNYESHRDVEEGYFKIGVAKSSLHFHRAVELVYCIKGRKEIYIEGEQLFLEEGELLLVPPYTVHFFPELKNHTSLCVIPPVSYSGIYSKAIGDKRLGSLIFNNRQVTKEAFDMLMRLENCESGLMRDGIYRYVIGFLLENAELVEGGGDRKDDFAFSALSYFEEHYTEKLSLERVAGALGYSRCHFSSLFKKALHTGFCDYLSMLRIEKSLPLLGTRPVNEVAEAVGFGSLQSYYANFKKVMGVSPAVYIGGDKK